jgi:hypothetical protein
MARRRDDDPVSACLVILAIIFAPLILAGISWGIYPWINSSVQFPIRACANGGVVLKSDNTILACSNGTASTYNEIFRVGTSLQYASILSDNTRDFQSVLWSDFTAENMCNQTSLIYQQYSLPNGICSSNGKLLVGGAYIPASIAGIVTMVMFPVFLFGTFAIVIISDNNRKRSATVIALVFGVLNLAAAAYTMYSWNYFAVPMNYLSSTKPTNVAPIWNATFVYLGTSRTSKGQNIQSYSIQRTKQIIPSPPLFNSYTTDGYNMWGGAIGVLCLDLAIVLAIMIIVFAEGRTDVAHLPRPTTTDTTTAPPPEPIPMATAVNDPEIPSNVPVAKMSIEIPRPGRPAPSNPEDEPAAAIAIV